MNAQELREQLEQVREQMRGKNRNHPREASEYEMLKRDEDALIVQIQEIEQKELTQQHEERMEQAAAQITTAIDMIEIGGEHYPLRAFITNEADYQEILIHFHRTYAAQAEAYSRQIAALEESHIKQLAGKDEEINQLQYQNAQLQLRNADLITALNNSEAQAANAEAAAKDFETKLKNASNEIDRLNSHVDDLRQQIAVGAKGAIQVQSTADFAEEQRKRLEARKVYNVRWKDDRTKQTYLANLLSTGEEIEISHFAIKSWTEVSAEEAARFRAEHAAATEQGAEQAAETGAEADNSALVEEQPSIPAPQFPSEVPVSGTGNDTVHGEVATPATLEERVAKLEAAVFGKVTEEAA